MGHSECSCTSESVDTCPSERRRHGDSRESSLCLDGCCQKNDEDGRVRLCKDECMAGIAGISNSMVHTGSVHTNNEVLVNTEQGCAGDSDTIPPMEPYGDFKGHWSSENEERMAAARDSSALLLNEAPFQPQYSVCDRNAVSCASPDHRKCMYKEDIQKHQTCKCIFVPNGATSSSVLYSKADGAQDVDTACTNVSRDSKKAASFIEVSHKIEHMARSLMERRTALSVCSKHNEADAACKTYGETRAQHARMNRAIDSSHISTKATHVPTGFAITKTQYKIFFTSEDAKNANIDTSIRKITFPQESSYFGKTKPEEKGHANTSCIYRNSQVLNLCTERAVVQDSVVPIVKKKHKDTIQVDCTTRQCTGPSTVSVSIRAADTRHTLHEDVVSQEDNLCDLVERLSTKNNIEDVCVPIQREVHYVDPEVTAKDARQEKRGFLCRFFSTLFGCCV
eukprot:jgi/Antlo1/731/165